MKIITISGKSGSGKSYVAKIIANSFDANIIFVDEISHKTLELEKIKQQIKEKFGDVVFDGNKINRKKLSDIVFNDEKKLEWLNKLCWPEMDMMIDKKLLKNKLNILDYSLLPKMKYFNESFKILVKAKKTVRKNRIILRDKIDIESFNLRENNSLIYNEKNFDIVILNNDSIDKSKLLSKIKTFLGENND